MGARLTPTHSYPTLIFHYLYLFPHQRGALFKSGWQPTLITILSLVRQSW